MNFLIIATYQDAGLNMLRCLASLKGRCHVMGPRAAYGLRLSKYCKKYIITETSEFEKPIKDIDIQDIAGKIADSCRKYNIDIVMPSDLPSVFLLSAIKNGLSVQSRVFPLSDPEILLNLHHKWLFSQFLAKHKLPQPDTLLLERAGDLDKLRINFPVIVKPVDLGNKLGIEKIESSEALQNYISSPHRYNKLPLLVQEWIPGDDIDLNILASNGKVVAYSIQKWLSADTIQFVTNDKVLKVGEKIISLLNHNGVAHFDMRIDSKDDSVKVIECNPRFWGTMRASMWNGINFLQLGILVAGGDKLPETYANRGITYTLPSKLLQQVMRGKLSILKRVSRESVSDLWQILSDPLSCAYMIGVRLLKRSQ